MIGIVGAGRWGQNHIKALAKLRVEGVIDDFIIIDVNKETLENFSKKYNCAGYESMSEALKAEELDGLIIATPTRLHYKHAKEALEQGLHVLVEKPIATTSEEALELINIARENNRVLMTGFLLRYSPAVQYIKDTLMKEPNYFGNILAILAKRINPRQAREYDVGVIKDLVIHDIDLVSYMFEATPRNAYAYIRKQESTFETFATGFVEYESTYDKLVLIFEASFLSPQKFRDWMILGVEKAAQLDLIEHKVKIYTRTDTLNPSIPTEADVLYRQDRNFVEAIQGKAAPLVTGLDGYRALKVCEALLQSAEKACTIRITF
ncbi:MAG: Gfo/Idh/MocA family oxidoreductase [Crenarchaeota archaeon]|nr:Gfo/Idh/MocA family oxidoreductase [Thermoproteota archaeon]MCR8455186.1 Gfo/Idh/MocA family oxidoreductase [Thermoproteota archaeon]